MYKIALFSDIHGNLEALEAIIADIENNYDDVIFLGDAIGLGPNPKECINLLHKHNIRWILGNHDLYYLYGVDKFNIEEEKLPHYAWVHSMLDGSDREILSKYDISYELNINNHKLLFSHYFIENKDYLYPFYSIGYIKNSTISNILKISNCDYFFYGHEHNPSIYKFNDKYLVDVGSSGCVKTDKTFYTIVEIDDEINIKRKEITYDRAKLINKLNNSTYDSIEIIKQDFFGIE